MHLPLRTTLGVSTSRALGEFDVVGAAAAVSLLRTNFFIPSGGAEVELQLARRLRRSRCARAAVGPFRARAGFTAGAGFTMDRLTIDYALETLVEFARRPPNRPADPLTCIAPRLPLPAHPCVAHLLIGTILAVGVHAGARAERRTTRPMVLVAPDHLGAEPR